jgi:hypothetical protein
MKTRSTRARAIASSWTLCLLLFFFPFICGKCFRSFCSSLDRGLGRTQRPLGPRRSTVTVAAVIWDTAAQTGAKRKRLCPTTNHVDSSAMDLDNGTANSLEVTSPITATAVELTHTATIDKSNEVYSKCTSYEVYSKCTFSDSLLILCLTTSLLRAASRPRDRSRRPSA